MNNQEKTIISPERPSNGAVFPMLPQQDFLGLGTPQDDNTLKDILSSIQRRILPIVGVASLVMSGFVYSSITADKIYQGEFRILVEPLTNEANLLSALSVPGGSNSQSGLDYSSQIQVLISEELMMEVLPKLQSSYPLLTYPSLVNRLTVRRLGETKIIQVSYKSANPEEIKSVLESLSQFYLKYSLEKRKTKLNQGLAFVDQQLPAIKARVNQYQQQLQKFRQKYEFVNPEEQSGSLVTQIQGLKAQRSDLEQRLALARASYSTLLTPEGQRAILNQAPIYGGLVSQLRQLEAQLSGELVRLQSDNPYIQTLKEKRESLLPLIEDEQKRYVGLRMAEITNTIDMLEVQDREVARTQQEARERFRLLPILARQHTDLQRNLQLANESFNRFLESREKLLIEAAQTEIPWEIIQSPVTSQLPILPNTQRDLTTGLFASLAAGLGLAFLLEKLDNTYHRPTNLEQKTKLPLLGTLPNAKKLLSYQARHQLKTQETKSPRLPRIHNPFTRRKKDSKAYGYGYYGGEGRFSQALQVLYANIKLLNSDQIVKSITVSSSVQSEGKTTIAARLAEVAASMGKRVLLVDCDLRLPRVHKELELPNLVGLSSVITSNLPVQEAVQNLPDLPTLSVMTSGTQPPDPMRLISSDKMKQIMTYFRENFDLVIYDTPPLTSIVDAKLLAAQTDGLLLVVKMHETDRSAVAQVLESLKQSSISVLGVVANRYKKKGGYGEYDYYYNYGSYTSTKQR
ncbi:GumC family protein [Cylindrospermopsis raciborskii]|uniref:GumC family protein n=1 Tax=Cylindrospermopsis raciborskii TaxID=77022 RepID=UPI0038D112DD